MVETYSKELTSTQHAAAERLIVSFDKPSPRALTRTLPRLPYSIHAFKMSQAVDNSIYADEVKREHKGKMFLGVQLVGSPEVLAANLRSVLGANRRYHPRYVSLHPAAEEQALKAAVETIKEVVHGDYTTDLVLASVPSTLDLDECRRASGNRLPIETVHYHAELAKACGINVVSCSGHFVSAVKSVHEDLVVIGDGARFTDDEMGDHKHTMTPLDMLREGVDLVSTGGTFVDKPEPFALEGLKKILTNIARYRPAA